MKLSEKTFSNRTLITVIPSSLKEDFSSILMKIKKLKMQPFHYVFIAIPDEFIIVFKKQLFDFGLDIKQFESKDGVSKLEIV